MADYIRYCFGLTWESGGVSLPVVKILLAITAAICVGQILLGREQMAVGKVYRRILKRGAIGEENAKTLADLGLGDNALARTTRRTTRFLCRTDDAQQGAKWYVEKVKVDDVRDYISRRETSPLRIALSCVMTVAIAVCLSLFMPLLLELIEKLLEAGRL